MQMDLNDPNDFTVANTGKLLASKDDSKHRQLRVTKNGIAYLSDDTGPENVEDLAFRLETWLAGNDYVGIRASQDQAWVKRIYDALKKNWPNPTDKYIDVF
jgi:hypothetical protein